jgi:peptidoglycan/LPS O-acetylase OafA/YrhL
MPPGLRNKKVRQPHLDGLRGAAACAVFFGHLLIALLPSMVTLVPNDIHTQFDLALGASPLGFLWNGNGAVCVFFVLSGYVLTSLAQRSGLSIFAQMVRRYLRLGLPMLIAALLPLALMTMGLMQNSAAAVAVTHSGWLGDWYHFQPSLAGAFKEMVYGAFATGQSAYNPILWTMRPELVGSLCIFFITAMTPNRYYRLACYAFFVFWSPADYYPLFAAGAVLFDFENEIGALLPRLMSGLLLLAGLYICSMPSGEVAPWHHWMPRFPAENSFHWHEIGAFLVVLGVQHSSVARAIFSSSLGQHLGRVSFTLYLIHLPIICSLTAWLVVRLAGANYHTVLFVAGGSTIIVVFGLSWILSKVVDQIPTEISRRVGSAINSFDLGSRNLIFAFDRSRAATGDTLGVNVAASGK